ncbi:MAG: general secretion pathway protein GspK [Kiritimatiellae bacterium]|nr:general secretion pathway protein GspK [Kiritimatiellia bacterium]
MILKGSLLKKLSNMRTSSKSKSGSALILVLVLIFVLSMIVMSFSFEAQIEQMYMRAARDRQKCRFYAESGFAIAEMLMKKQTGISPSATMSADDEEDRWYEAAALLAKGMPINGLVEPIGDGYVILDIVPEPGRINVNKLTESDWERLLESIGVPEEYWEKIIDPVLDWMDDDDASNPKGAETEDYYSELEAPYKAKNGPVDTVRELLLVKGFSEVLLTGGVFDPATLDGDVQKNRFSSTYNRFSETNEIVIAGLENMLTTYGDGKINIQSADYDVLRTLPEVDDILARAIIEERELIEDGEPQPFTSVEDLFERIEGLDESIRNMISVDSEYYRITSVGRVNNIDVRIWCIAYISDGKLEILRWCEEP